MNTVNRTRGIWLLLLTIFPVISAHAQTRPAISVSPLAVTFGVSPSVADNLQSMLISAMAEIHYLRVVDPQSSSRAGEISINLFQLLSPETPAELDIDLLLTGTVWPESIGESDRYYAIIQILDARNGAIVSSEILDLDSDTIWFGIREWRDGLELTVRDAGGFGTGAGARVLLNEKLFELAWEHYLNDIRFGKPGDWTLEQEIRNSLAGNNTQTTLRSRTLSADLVEQLLVASLVSVDKDTVSPLRDRMVEEMDKVYDRAFRELEREVRRALRRKEFDEAGDALSTDTALRLRLQDPDRHEAMVNRLEQETWKQMIRETRSQQRQGEFDYGRETITEAIQLNIYPEQSLATMETLEKRSNRVDQQIMRARSLPDPREPRTSSDRLLWAGLSGATMGDPLQRYLLNATAAHVSIGIGRARPIVPYIREIGRVGAGFAEFKAAEDGLESHAIRGDLDFALGIAAGTERAEVGLVATTGLSAFWGSRARAEDEEKQMLRIGPTLGIELEASLYYPGHRVRSSLYAAVGRTLWLPDLYFTPAYAIGIRLGWIR